MIWIKKLQTQSCPSWGVKTTEPLSRSRFNINKVPVRLGQIKALYICGIPLYLLFEQLCVVVQIPVIKGQTYRHKVHPVLLMRQICYYNTKMFVHKWTKYMYMYIYMYKFINKCFNSNFILKNFPQKLNKRYYKIVSKPCFSFAFSNASLPSPKTSISYTSSDLTSRSKVSTGVK